MCEGRRAALAWLAFAAVGAGEASAVQVETGAGGFPTGRVIGNVAARDASRSFALYIPSDYSPGRRWPLVLILDPRGRGEAALRPLVASAERLGYVLASSDNTASDVEGDPNTPAVNAVLATEDRVVEAERALNSARVDLDFWRQTEVLRTDLILPLADRLEALRHHPGAPGRFSSHTQLGKLHLSIFGTRPGGSAKAGFFAGSIVHQIESSLKGLPGTIKRREAHLRQAQAELDQAITEAGL